MTNRKIAGLYSRQTSLTKMGKKRRYFEWEKLKVFFFLLFVEQKAKGLRDSFLTTCKTSFQHSYRNLIPDMHISAGDQVYIHITLSLAVTAMLNKRWSSIGCALRYKAAGCNSPKNEGWIEWACFVAYFVLVCGQLFRLPSSPLHVQSERSFCSRYFVIWSSSVNNFMFVSLYRTRRRACRFRRVASCFSCRWELFWFSRVRQTFRWFLRSIPIRACVWFEHSFLLLLIHFVLELQGQ